MATEIAKHGASPVIEPDSKDRWPTLGSDFRRVLEPLASLKITVALFAMSILLIFAGTLAQVDKDIWEVMNLYFRTFVARIDFEVFVPRSMFPGRGEIPGYFWFPGGWSIGGAMMINLLAAHGLRFKVQARGSRLLFGVAVIAAGAGLTFLLIRGGSGKETIEGASLAYWSSLWTWMKLGLTGLWLANVYVVLQLDAARKLERRILASTAIALGGALAWLWLFGVDASPGAPSMRIMSQLLKAELAALVLLAGCLLLFRKRAGIVLLHAGVGLMMANELVVYKLHVEGQMNIREGETAHYAQDIRTVELAVVDSSGAKFDKVVVVPKSKLLGDDVIQGEALPFDVRVVRFLQNARIQRPEPGDENAANAGAGVHWIAREFRPGSGADTDSKVDLSAAYVKLLNQQTGRAIGTYLLSLELNPQRVEVDQKSYEVALRFKRVYKPYSLRLDDVRYDKYTGTQMARNYSSDLRLIDPTRNVERHVKIWMNNPLRFAGETFYQSGVDETETVTTLQVVSNAGWMLPYAACMIVVTGMLAQFLITLTRFLRRRAEQPRSASIDVAHNRRRSLGDWLPAGVVTLLALWLVSNALPERSPAGNMRLQDFGKLPVTDHGRLKPMDSLARDSLRIISGKQTFKFGEDTYPAIKWLLDVMARPEQAAKYEVFRIENLEVLETLGLKRRQGLKYSLNDFKDRVKQLRAEAERASSTDPAELSPYQRKIVELNKKYQLFIVLTRAFEPPLISRENPVEDWKQAKQEQQLLATVQPPLAIPPAAGEDWQPYSTAWMAAAEATMLGRKPNPATVSFASILAAYDGGDAVEFNKQVDQYRAYVSQNVPERLNLEKVEFESFFNHFSPFFYAAVFYLIAFLLACFGWLAGSGPLNRTAFWLIILTLAVHTTALVARIYISGRPPVTTLYSSAVFIGWGCVIAGVILESLYRLGIGNVVAAVGGFSTLLIAHFLAADGDTFPVLQAVLDTQFWLATHVTCITLGYAATYVAGLLGMLYVLRGALTSSLSPQLSKNMARMIYGTVCFAMLFSFFGTVLGGLWADDSWGRFWGWDPKENGALIIVLWNALVLHARWGGMVKDRGLAVLAVVGNIVTSWSWFGVNELGIGLHNYGFTEGVLLALGIFIASQLALIGLGTIGKRLWLSSQSLDSSSAAV